MAERETSYISEDEALRRFFDAHHSEQAERRTGVVQRASRMIGAILGQEYGVDRLPGSMVPELDSGPEGLPALRWTISRLTAGTAPGENGITTVHIVGNIGEYYTSEHDDERPSDVFNAGFYAGVIAAREGLVDVALFKREAELYESEEAEETAAGTE